MATSAHGKPKAFRRARLWLALAMAVALGAAVAALVTWTPHGRAIELKVSDSFRPAAALREESGVLAGLPVTIIAIDDRAIQTFGHWPWPWTDLADAIDLLKDLGARLIVLDIEFPEEDAPRVVEDAAPGGQPTERIVRTVPRLVESIRRAGNVLVPFSLYVSPARVARGDKDPAATAPPAAPAGPDEATPASPGPGDAAVMAVKPESSLAVAEILSRHAVRLASGPREGLLEATDFQPMIPALGEACAASGYTSFRHDAEDSVVRRIPLLVRADETVLGADKVFPHLMLEAAGVWRFGPDYHVRMAGNRLILSAADERGGPPGKESVAVRVDDAAQVELRWPASLKDIDTVPVVPLLIQCPGSRHRYRTVLAKLDALWPEEGWAAARRQLDDAERTATPAAGTADLRRQVAAVEERLTMNLLTAAAETRRPVGQVRQDETAAGDLAARAADAIARKALVLRSEHLNFLSEYHEWHQREQPLADLLRPHVAGRLCIVGRYATGVSDFHATPIGNNQPGVTVYPAGIATILSGVSFRHLARWQEWAVTILAAALAAAATFRLSAGQGAAATILLALLIISAAWVASAQGALLLPVAGPVLAGVVAFAGVSGYKQLTEASTRRWITRAFQHYVPAEHVEQLVRDPELLCLGGARRDITVLFSDIAGFTPLAERLGPEALVALLHHYLSTMTDALLAERGRLDKYEGDGILGLFGAPVPAADHALCAVRAALAMQAALPRVNQDLLGMDLLQEGTRLAMRIGCSSGPAIVGNFGSEQQFNYTAMGDTVNLGGRLEEANRWLGSRILVPEATRAACGEAVLWRRFGPARIRGKAQPVLLYEPLALEPAPAEVRAVADAFNRVTDALAARDLPAAEAALADLLAIAPDDGPARVLKTRLEAIRAGRAAPDDPWDLARPK